MSVITEFENVEDALWWVKTYRQKLPSDSFEVELLLNVLGSDKLIEVAILSDELYGNFGRRTRHEILAEVLILLNIDYHDTQLVIDHPHKLSSIASYLNAIQYLVDCGFDEACLVD